MKRIPVMVFYDCPCKGCEQCGEPVRGWVFVLLDTEPQNIEEIVANVRNYQQHGGHFNNDDDRMMIIGGPMRIGENPRLIVGEEKIRILSMRFPYEMRADIDAQVRKAYT